MYSVGCKVECNNTDSLSCWSDWGMPPALLPSVSESDSNSISLSESVTDLTSSGMTFLYLGVKFVLEAV